MEPFFSLTFVCVLLHVTCKSKRRLILLPQYLDQLLETSLVLTSYHRDATKKILFVYSEEKRAELNVKSSYDSVSVRAFSKQTC